MRFSTVVAALIPAIAVSAEKFTVVVGGNSTLTFQPNTVTAKQGDVIAFQFASKNHTVTQSTFATPCTLNPNGVDSGFQAVPAGTANLPEWSFTVQNASAPLWFYCKQTGHCGMGMVFAINPTAEKSFSAFQTAAKAAAPAAAAGGSAAGGGSAYPGTSGSGSSANPASGVSGSASSAQATQSSSAMKLGGGAASSITLVAAAIAGLLL